MSSKKAASFNFSSLWYQWLDDLTKELNSKHLTAKHMV